MLKLGLEPITGKKEKNYFEILQLFQLKFQPLYTVSHLVYEMVVLTLLAIMKKYGH